MKKLIAIAALAACLPAFSGQVASSNTVGYQKLTLEEGFNWVAPQFLNIAETGIHIQQVQLDIDENTATGLENIQILDSTGSTTDTYFWLPAAWMGTAGWYDENIALADVTIAKGQSFIVSCLGTTDCKVFGAVGSEDYNTTAVQGFNWVGNSTPVTISIQDVLINVPEDTATGLDNIQMLDSNGNTVSTYFWLPAAWMGTAGWYDENIQLSDETIDAGKGFIVDTSAGLNISIPSAL